MSKAPEQEARETIDQMLGLAGWNVQDCRDANIHARFGVAIRNFPLKSGHGFADYILYVNEKAAGVVEAKKVGSTLTGVEIQSGKVIRKLLKQVDIELEWAEHLRQSILKKAFSGKLVPRDGVESSSSLGNET